MSEHGEQFISFCGFDHLVIGGIIFPTEPFTKPRESLWMDERNVDLGVCDNGVDICSLLFLTRCLLHYFGEAERFLSKQLRM